MDDGTDIVRMIPRRCAGIKPKHPRTREKPYSPDILFILYLHSFKKLTSAAILFVLIIGLIF